jgi:hypothetical protein
MSKKDTLSLAPKLSPKLDLLLKFTETELKQLFERGILELDTSAKALKNNKILKCNLTKVGIKYIQEAVAKHMLSARGDQVKGSKKDLKVKKPK